jgi:ABC-2 type transport system permease protein
MNTMKWLLKREYWENKGGFFWAPAVVGAIMVLLIAVGSILGLVFNSKHGIVIDGEQVTNLSKALDAGEKAQVIDAISQGYAIAASAPLLLVMIISVFFFCLGSLYDERKDKSVLFWKSLPVSDTETVLSKALMALVGAPLITIALGTVIGFILLLLVFLFAGIGGINLLGVLAQPATYLAPFELLAILPVYLLWALPTVGWLMLVSAWARRVPFLWAVGVPVMTGVLITWFNAIFDSGWNVEWFWQHVVGRGLGSLVPGIWFAFTDVGHHLGNGVGHQDDVGLMELVGASYRVLGTANLWIGVVLGAAMIYGAIRLRRWRDEG